MNLKKFQFGSLPGPIGFLFYSGSLLVVGIGMIILVLIILGSESLVFKLTGNPLLCALWGGVMASSVSQMGLAPRGYLIYLFELSSEVVVIWFIQSEWFYMLLQRLKIFPSTKDIFPWKKDYSFMPWISIKVADDCCWWQYWTHCQRTTKLYWP